MIVETLVLANPFVLLPGRQGTPRRMSDCPEDMHAYWRLGEYLLKQIENSTDEVITIYLTDYIDPYLFLIYFVHSFII